MAPSSRRSLDTAKLRSCQLLSMLTSNKFPAVHQVGLGSPASQAGLLPGDRILQFGDADTDLAALAEQVTVSRDPLRFLHRRHFPLQQKAAI